MDAHPVTNRAFAKFVRETGYVTVAERPLDPASYPGIDPKSLKPGAMVFRKSRGPVDLGNWRNWWDYVRGAHWRKPEGKENVFRGRQDHPVVDIAYEDALAYADWIGKMLPSEAEWEYGARGGLVDAEFVWGDVFMPDGRHMANTWQGRFPYENLAEDGYEGTSPVGSFPANGYGLHDMAGNVWEWTTDWYLSDSRPQAAKSCCTAAQDSAERARSFDPALPDIKIPRKVIKGGSFLCAPDYCSRYRPAARQPQMIDTAAPHIGFRCIVRGPH
jgi:formylglycine-generating enzyme required for sulfatase activity